MHETEIIDNGVAATVHQPSARPAGTVILTHGAGSNRHAPILRAVAAELVRRNLTVARIDLAFRQRRNSGPPQPARAHEDRNSLTIAINRLRDQAPLIVGGHSYGGRQASMVLADNPALADGLLLLSYPLHPPKKPEVLRTEHLAQLTTPTTIVRGESDPFGTADEMIRAFAVVTPPPEIVTMARAGHDLKPARAGTATLIGDAVSDLLDRVR